MPYKNILVAIDGSEASKKAAWEAIRIAKLGGSALLAVYVIPMTPEVIEYFRMAKIKKALKEEAEKAIEEVKQKAYEEGLRDFNILIEEGNPPERIVQIAAINGCDLLVMGTRGHSTWEKILIGSVAERATSLAPCPVLLVRS